jgi:hypothetical protein
MAKKSNKVSPIMSARNSLFAPNSSKGISSGEKLQTLYFFLPGGADLYTTKRIKEYEGDKPVSVWPIDDIAVRAPNYLEGKITGESKGLQVGSFFLQEKDAFTAAKKAFSKIPISIIKISLPEKAAKEILKTPDKKSKHVFDFNLMPYVESITAFTSQNKFEQGVLFQKISSRNEFGFDQANIALSSTPSPKK